MRKALLISHGTNKGWFLPWRRELVTEWPLPACGMGTEFLRGPLLGLKVPKGCILYPGTPDWGLH